MAATDRILMQTRIPAALRLYLKAYAKQHRERMEHSCQSILALFLQCQPWQQGLCWREPHSNRSQQGERQGWGQFNLYVSPELAAQLRSLAREQNLSLASVTYTGLVWFVKFIAPPVSPP